MVVVSSRRARRTGKGVGANDSSATSERSAAEATNNDIFGIGRMSGRRRGVHQAQRREGEEFIRPMSINQPDVGVEQVIVLQLGAPHKQSTRQGLVQQFMVARMSHHLSRRTLN